ncbi:uncharacterized protein SPPG_07788 [Spizellomyces punctatus DAOM BR117]|uniref:Impact N-terminal domain-containing protein n=1 Tax=Spizellomyces punctatus (strain DAOM BR117) TaxID=645134 RepID=A0A0L0H8F3_SPIPD|nr:uncharacterized protein SPPG_07788 [Spizellomyces punctatus DAOM BR117]KNC96968.1 hypothetical protein SPPG_07788 [Spizellomyces punctatus DAOM BR117]|eukprot:XP_016605008.1 hypothetical protein SPPG_07788 [Spizellomyces punctatus DAOM BR117]
MKRSLPDSHSSPQDDKRPRTSHDALPATNTNPPPTIFVSSSISDRKSTFVAHAAEVRSPQDLSRLTQTITSSKATQNASHNIRAWRYLSLKPGKTGLEGPDDFGVVSGYDDDGEKWAGSKIAKILEQFQVVDVVVIVSRWYGGVLLGSARFRHIEQVTKEVLELGGWIGRPRQVSPSPAQPVVTATGMTLEKAEKLLRAKDSTVDHLRQRLESAGSGPLTANPSLPSPTKGYSGLTLEKAERLIKARDSTIAHLRQRLLEQEIANADSTGSELNTIKHTSL